IKTCDRVLAFSQKQEDLTDKPKPKDFNAIGQTNIGVKWGNTFYIAAEKNGQLRGYSWAGWKAAKPAFDLAEKTATSVKEAITGPVKNFIQGHYKRINENPYKDKVAKVRQGNDLNPDEKAYRAKRAPIVQKTLESLLGVSMQQPLNIAVIESGGGYRAMTCSAGGHEGLAAIGLMDGITYLVGLSGSTWSIGVWTLSELPIDKFKDYLIKGMERGLATLDGYDIKKINNHLLVKAALDQPLTLVDIYGSLLATALLEKFGGKRLRVGLSEQAQIIADGSRPYPIYTAVRGDDPKGDGLSSDWYEFTPHEVGASWFGKKGMYIPSAAFDSQFNDGESKYFAVPQSFGYLMGTFGSAFAASFAQIVDTLKSQAPSKNASNKAFEEDVEGSDISEKTVEESNIVLDAILDRIGNERITSAVVHNFTKGMQDSQLQHQEYLKLVDAGLAFNLPFPPVGDDRRPMDVIMILDASEDVPKGLRKTAQYAKDRGLKFPSIDVNDSELLKHAVTVFKDANDRTIPVVIYMPRVKDEALLDGAIQSGQFKEQVVLLKDFDIEQCVSKGFCNTFNFNYKKDEIEKLFALFAFNVRASKDTILDALKWKAGQLNPKSVVNQSNVSVNADSDKAQGAAVSAAQQALSAAQNPGNEVFFNAGGASKMAHALQQFINSPTVAQARIVLDANLTASDKGNAGPAGFLAVGGVGDALALVTEYVKSHIVLSSAQLAAQGAAIAAAKTALAAAQNSGNGVFFKFGGASQLVNALQQFITNPTVANGQAVLDANSAGSENAATGSAKGFLGVNGVGGFDELTAYVQAK
ncbi:MAG: hypothetical protein NTX86_00065, partial [Candidatus Dependentiae bacterium]|nr:hypothetical protein [Candidatus Dependentiae bacterium]